VELVSTYQGFRWHTDKTGRVATSYDIRRQLLMSEVQHMAEINVSRFIDNSTTVSTNVNATNSTVFQVYDHDSSKKLIIPVITYTAVVLGISGNILSVIIWLRLQATSKNSSAIYLAALAVVDLVYLTSFLMEKRSVCGTGWFCKCCTYLRASTEILDPLLVLGFSVERLIAILRPFQV